MKFVVSVFFIMFFFTSCRDKNKVPPGIIPENQFVSILVDVHIADATLNILQVKDPKFKFTSNEYYYSVLKKHNVNKQQFDKSLEYYSMDLVRFNKIYDEVLRRLSIIEGSLAKKNLSNKLAEKNIHR